MKSKSYSRKQVYLELTQRRHLWDWRSFVWEPPHQWSGKFLGIITGWDPSVLQVQPVTCWHPPVFLYKIGIYSIDSSKMIGNFLAVLNFNQLFFKLNRFICNKRPVLPDHSPTFYGLKIKNQYWTGICECMVSIGTQHQSWYQRAYHTRIEIILLVITLTFISGWEKICIPEFLFESIPF